MAMVAIWRKVKCARAAIKISGAKKAARACKEVLTAWPLCCASSPHSRCAIGSLLEGENARRLGKFEVVQSGHHGRNKASQGTKEGM